MGVTTIIHPQTYYEFRLRYSLKQYPACRNSLEAAVRARVLALAPGIFIKFESVNSKGPHLQLTFVRCDGMNDVEYSNWMSAWTLTSIDPTQ